MTALALIDWRHAGSRVRRGYFVRDSLFLERLVLLVAGPAMAAKPGLFF